MRPPSAIFLHLCVALSSFVLGSCALSVKVREEWKPVHRHPIPLEESAATWREIASGRLPEPGPLKDYNEATRDSVVQIAGNWADGDVGSRLRTTGGDVSLRVNSVNVPGLANAEEVVPADFVKVRRGLRTETVVEGIGAPLIVRQPKTDADPYIPESGLWVPVTALFNLTEPERPVLELIDPTEVDTVTFGGRQFPLSADYTAAFARDFQDRQLLFNSLAGLLNFEKFADRMGLYRVTPFHPEKAPVIFIHGINSSPSTWDETLNQLYNDPEIRARYEFYTYGYPTGAPIPYLAAEYRKAIREMLAFRRANGSKRNDLTIVGHSMGGLLSKAMTFSSGEEEWSHLFKVGIDDLDVSAEERETLRSMLFFEPIEEVRRVVFCATPHGGSRIVKATPVKLVGQLIDVPSQLLFLTSDLLKRSRDALTPAGIEYADRRINALDQLGVDTWTTAYFLNKPLDPDIRFHSIIGNNRSESCPLERSGDGIVPYASAHLEGVESELVVRPSGHAVHRQEKAIEEIRRILKLR